VVTPEDCLNLRPEPSWESRPIACRQDGAVLEPARPVAGGVGVRYDRDETWIHVTTGGPSGWVSARYLAWDLEREPRG
jgi:hypothetical protein